MGVIRNFNNLNNNNNLFDSDLIEDIIDNIIDNFEPEFDVERGVRSQRSYRNRENRLRRNRLRPEPTFRALGVGGKSHKKNRRYANANLLSQQFESLSNEEEVDDISIYDFIPQTVSAFAQLLIQTENSNTWNDLINCTEDQQNQLLDQIQAEAEARTQKEPKRIDNQTNSSQTEPAFSADQCFKRIDSDLKNMLKKKHIPLGVLAQIEEQIIDFFNDNPISVYKSCLSSGFHRSLLHMCCQYLDLKCFSFDTRGERWSKVENNNTYFAQPSVMLAKYLENRYSFS